MSEIGLAPSPSRIKLRLSADRSFLCLGILQIGLGLLYLSGRTHHHWLAGSVWSLIGLTSLFRSNFGPRADRDPFAPISLFNGDIPAELVPHQLP